MPTFAVTYNYSASAEQLAELRPIHREWLVKMHSEGNLLASGPMVNTSTALLIWRAESARQLSQVLDNDPFDVAGFIGERVIEEWNPIIGPWEEK